MKTKSKLKEDLDRQSTILLAVLTGEGRGRQLIAEHNDYWEILNHGIVQRFNKAHICGYRNVKYK